MCLLCFFSLFVYLLLPKHCSCRGLLLHLITFSVTCTLGRIPPDEGSARRRDVYMTAHNIHTRPASMSPEKFEPAILTGERPQTHPLHRAAAGIRCPLVFCTTDIYLLQLGFQPVAVLGKFVYK